MLLFYLSLLAEIFLPHVDTLAISKDHPYLSPKHNKSFYYPKYRHEIFYDNKILPEDVEVDTFIHKGQVQKFFYLLEGGYRPISVTVTPCSSDSLLEWKLSHNIFPISSSPYHSDPWTNHVIRPPSISPTASYVGKKRRSYTNPRAPPGLYTLEVRSSAETNAKLLVTTRPPSQMPYHPPLPPESAVQIIKIKRNRILISWKASLSGRPLEYCVTSNTRGNYNSLCSAEGDMHGGNPFYSPVSTGYTYHYGTKQLHNSLQEPAKHGAAITCVGRKTWHMFKGLQRGIIYYFDVFVMDVDTNASSVYIGVSAAVKNVPSSPSRLKDDSLVTYNLDASNGFAVDTKYHLGRSSGPILLFIQSCTGPGPVTLTVTQNVSPRHEILSTNVMDVKTLEIPRQMAALINGSNIQTLSIRSSTKHARKVRVWISNKKHAFPFPVLPPDKSVSVFDTLTTCDAITIGWKASPDERVKYCIYRQAAHDELMQRTLTEPQNFCEEPAEGSVLKRITVLCRRYHRFSKRRFNNVIMQRVKGLKPGTTYLFEVQVTKVKGKMLPYEQVWATTHSTCARHNR